MDVRSSYWLGLVYMSKLAAAIREKIKKLWRAPIPFDQQRMADRVNLASAMLDDLRKNPLKDKRLNSEIHREVSGLFHHVWAEAFPKDFWADQNRLKAGNPKGLENAIQFLECDPMFFRSGYIKADLAKYIRRVPISDRDAERLEQVILKVLDSRDCREFREYCRLARKLNSERLWTEIDSRLLSDDPAIRRRAKWIKKDSHKKGHTQFLKRGISLFEQQRFKESVGELNQAVLIESSCPQARLFRGISLGRLGRWREAIEDLSLVCNYQNSDLTLMQCRHEIALLPALRWRGWCLAKNQEYALAVEDFTQAIKIDPCESFFFRGRADAYFNLRKFELSKLDLLECLRLDSFDQEALKLIELCNAEFELGQT